MKQTKKEISEFDQMMREGIELGNPFSGYTSYQSYRAKNRNESTKKESTKKELTEKEKILKEKIHKTIEKNRNFPF